ncbi:MAG: hypothetical protein IMF14_09255 [Proteobacteria bacterium]|nr:hypothetical protein [Pseudomonadota bacterium]
MPVSRKLVALSILLVSSKLFAVEFPVEVSEYIDDVKIDAYINKKDINEQSKWTPFKTAPGLSVDAALAAVDKYINTRTEFKDTRLISIELKPIPHYEAYWYYLVKTKSAVSNEIKPHFFIVLMDGKVVSAIKEPDAIK